MKVLVTGGCGFIGSHMVDLCLEEGHEVLVLDNFSTGRPDNLKHVHGKVRVVECDLAKDSLDEHFAGVDWVVHLAALADIVPSIQNPQAYYESNVTGTLRVLQAAHKAGIQRFVYAASSSCYGIPNSYPTPENAAIQPQYPYALTKRMGEELVLHWAQVYKLPALSLRFFNVYGPRSRTSGTYGAVFGVFLAQKLANQPFTIVGDGTQTRDFTYVTDIASALLAALQSDKRNEVYNVGSGESVSVNRIVELLGGDSIHIPKRPGEPDCTFADIAKISKDLDWKPQVKIDEGITRLIENIDYWRQAPVWDKESIAEATKDWFTYLSK